jgi:hypothetical protein
MLQLFEAETAIVHRIAGPVISYQEPFGSDIFHQITRRAFQELPVISENTKSLSLSLDAREFPSDRTNLCDEFRMFVFLGSHCRKPKEFGFSSITPFFSLLLSSVLQDMVDQVDMLIPDISPSLFPPDLSHQHSALLS